MDKPALLDLLAGVRCPVCGGEKARQQWTCSPCYKPLMDSAEHLGLKAACDRHLVAAEAFLLAARKQLIHTRA